MAGSAATVTVDFASVAPRTATTPLLGLTAAERAVLAAQAAGYGAVCLLVPPEDKSAVESALAANRRIAIRVDVRDGGDPAEAVPGDIPLYPQLLAQAKRADGSCDAAAVAAASAARFTPDRTADAERALLDALKKPADGVVSRHINRRISLFLTRHLARTNALPNHVTAVVLLLGVASAVCGFTVSGRLGLVATSALYYASAILDGTDGELSRLKYLGTPLGAWLDTVVDDVVVLLFAAGLHYRLWATHHHALWLVLGGVSIGAYAITMLGRYVALVHMKTGDYQKLSAHKKQTTEPNAVVRLFRDVLLRMDFVPLFATAMALVGASRVFAVLFAAGTVATTFDALRDAVTAPRAPSGGV